MGRDDRRYFIVKHGLDAFLALPTFIWRTGMGPNVPPHRFSHVRVGDRWIGFAYTTGDDRDRSLSLVTGFFGCTEEKAYRQIPAAGLMASAGGRKAWMIKGKSCGRQPQRPVGVPPIANLLGRRLWNNQALIPIKGEEFEYIRDYTLSHELDTAGIPVIRREPECEQELLAIVVAHHEELGIERILRVRRAFPDLLVKIKGKREAVHLELELYSSGFMSHGHHHQVSRGCFKEDSGQRRPVAVLCWIDNNYTEVSKHVHRVYELQHLLREKEKIRW